MSKCTWLECKLEAVKQYEDSNGKMWANLCRKHHELLDAVIQDGESKLIIATWVKAQGGAEKAANRLINCS